MNLMYNYFLRVSKYEKEYWIWSNNELKLFNLTSHLQKKKMNH